LADGALGRRDQRAASETNKEQQMSKTIGILGGMSAESTVTYYELITRGYQETHNDYGYPEIIIHSVAFQQVVDWQHQNDWERIGDYLGSCMASLESAGADFAVIATNTMHYVYDAIAARVSIPVLSIIDATAEAIVAAGLDTIGLLGTDFTMSQDFYKEGLVAHGISTLVPPVDERSLVNRIIYQELTMGIISPESRTAYAEVIRRLQLRGAQGVILGCTEIPLLIGPADADIPLFDTTSIHAAKALAYAMEAD
jgi:aspartate racemase